MNTPKPVEEIKGDPTHCMTHCRRHGWTRHYKAPDHRKRRGFSPRCLICAKEAFHRWNSRNPEYNTIYKRKWRKEHSDQNRRTQRHWRRANREYVRWKNRQWRRANRWYDRDRRSIESNRLIDNLRRSINRALQNHNYKGSFRHLPYSPAEFVADFEAKKKAQGNACPICGTSYTRVKPVVDHIIPLASADGNFQKIIELFALSNMRPLCPTCNIRKHARLNAMEPLINNLPVKSFDESN